MKKRLFLVFLMATIFLCVLAFSVNAEETGTLSYDRTYRIDGVDYPLWEQDANGNYHPLTWYVNSQNQMCSAWTDGVVNAKGTYIKIACFENQLGKMTLYESDGTTYTSDTAFVIVNFNGVMLNYNNESYIPKYIHSKVFHTNTTLQSVTELILNENTVLKAVFLPQTLEHIGWDNKITDITTSFYSFNNCTALEYVEFNSNTVFDDNTLNRGAFLNCSSLKAISLPNSIQAIGSAAFDNCTALEAVYLSNSLTTISSAGNPFVGCSNAYFVNEPFTMSSSSDVPQKPTAYYLPESLTNFGALALSANTNEVVVIGKNTTAHSTKMFAGSGAKAVVYLGNMTSFSLTATQSTTLNILMINTTAEPAVSVSGDTSGSTVSLCKLNKHLVLGESEWKNGAIHTEDPSKAVTVNEATCADNAKKDTYCFCEEYIGVADVEGTAGNGPHNLENATIINVVYNDFTETGYKTIKCAKCGSEDITEQAEALFTCLGYSAPEDGRDGIAIGFTVNNEAIREYEEVTGKTLKYGVFAVLKDRLGNNDVFAEDGTVAEGVINAEITNYEFVAFELKIVGFTDEYKDTKLAMGAYVAVTDGETTEYSYMQGGAPSEGDNYYYVSYNDIVPPATPDEGVTEQ